MTLSAAPSYDRRPLVPAAAGLDRAYALTRIDAARLNVADEAEAVRLIVADAGAGRGGTVFTLNLDHLVKLDESAAFRAAYERATYVTADGVPVVLMARQLGADIHRVTGADLVEPLCRAAAEAGVPVFLFGSTPEVLDKSGARLLQQTPDLKIAGTEAPPFGFQPHSAEAAEAARRIEASGAGICFVALGAPKQELFANAAVCHSSRVVYVCVGAALDFLAGAQRRAPASLSRFGLEWAWRLVHNPRRLTRRYVRSALYLLRYIAGGLLKGLKRLFV